MTMNPPRPELRRVAMWTPILLCLGINIAILLSIALCNKDYMFNYKLNQNPDARHYVLLGRNALLHGHFSRCDAPPYKPDMLRTPVYPIFAGALEICGNAAAIYIFQAFLQAASCALVYILATRHFGSLTGFFASILIATDVMWATSNFEAMSEPLFVFLLLLSLEQFSRALSCTQS